METLTNIQTDFRTWANASNQSLTSGANLRLFNQIFRGMCSPGYSLLGRKIGRRWPEFTRENTSLTSVASQEQYTWPTSPNLKRPFYIEYLDASSDDYPYPLTEVTNAETWSAWDSSISQTGIPRLYRLLDVTGVVKLALRPNPDTTTDTIRITSLIGATRWPSIYTTTIDLDSSAAQTVLSVASTTPFPAGSHVIIGEGTTREERATVASLSAGVSLTMAAVLTYAHTAAQADVVELMTPFLDDDVDQALALFVAAAWKANKGDPQRAVELIEQGLGLLPRGDTTPVLTSGGYIKPWPV